MFDQKSTGTERKQFLQSILHQDEGDDEEENEAPDDETINFMIARGQEEIELFSKMDAEREKDDAKRDETRKGRLMDEAELPDWLLRDDDDAIWDDEEEDISLKKRQRKEVDYSDSLTEKEWLKVIGASMDEEGNEEDDGTGSNNGGNGGKKAQLIALYLALFKGIF